MLFKGFEQQVMEKGANAFDTEGQNLYQCIMMRAAYLDRSEEFDSGEWIYRDWMNRHSSLKRQIR